MNEKIIKLLKEWLQAKDKDAEAIVFTDDIAISEVADELVKLYDAEVEKRIAERKLKEDVLIERIAQLYYSGDYHDQAQIAKICDEALDRSGGLLGKVRDKSYELRSRLTKPGAETSQKTEEGGE